MHLLKQLLVYLYGIKIILELLRMKGSGFFLHSFWSQSWLSMSVSVWPSADKYNIADRGTNWLQLMHGAHQVTSCFILCQLIVHVQESNVKDASDCQNLIADFFCLCYLSCVSLRQYVFNLSVYLCIYVHCSLVAEWLACRQSGAEGPGFKSQPWRCRVTVLGKLFTPVVPFFTKQRNW